MDDAAKLARVKVFLGIDDTSKDTLLTAYLDSAKAELLAWVYSYTPLYETVTEVPAQYEQVQINAVVAGYTQRGAEGQSKSVENGITREFSYADMASYIHGNCIPKAGAPR